MLLYLYPWASNNSFEAEGRVLLSSILIFYNIKLIFSSSPNYILVAKYNNSIAFSESDVSIL